MAPNAVRLCWDHNDQNTDGTAAALTGFRVYFGTSGLTNFQSISGASTRDALLTNLSPGLYTFAVAAVSGLGESDPSCTFTKQIAGEPIPPVPVSPLGNPTQAPSFTYTVNTPPSVIVTISDLSGPVSPELGLTITGTADALIALTPGNAWDWCKPGGLPGTTVTPTIPTMGVMNNDNQNPRHAAITVRGPVTTRCDIDDVVSNTRFAGGTVTVNGIAKPLVNVSGVWSASFP